MIDTTELPSAFPIYFLTTFLQVLCYYPTHLTFRRWIAPIMAGVSIYALTHTTTNATVHDYSLGCAFTFTFMTVLSHVYFEDFPNDLRRVKDGLQVKPSDLSFSQKLRWVCDFATNPRRVGWNQELAVLPPRSKLSRWHFVLTETLWSFAWFAIRTICLRHQSMNPSFDARSEGPLGITRFPIYSPHRSLDVLAWGVEVMAGLRLQHSAAAALFVGLGLSTVEDWPPLFGSFSDSWSLRRFWGRSWHQMLRPWVSCCGKSTARFLNFKPGTNASSYTQLYVAFILSGLGHYGGDCMVTHSFKKPFSPPFFIIQAFAITAEDFVIWSGKKIGLSGSKWKVVGYIWVAIWFCWSVSTTQPAIGWVRMDTYSEAA